MKKSKSKGRRSTRIADFRPQDIDASSTSSTSKDMEFSSNAYIDHRQLEDLSNLRSSPSKMRRRSSYSQSAPAQHQIHRRNTTALPTTPLTNRNLQEHLNQDYESRLRSYQSLSVSPNTANRHMSGPSGNGIALDMDRFAREQETMAQSWHNPFEEHSDNASFNSLEFGGSNPSSDHSGDSTSLDDVCFPDYYDNNDLDTPNISWPDLRVLKEFIQQEREELSEELQEAGPSVNFHSTIAKEATPGNKRVSELDSVDTSRHNSLKIRPNPIQPWDKRNDELVTTAPILNEPYNRKSNKVNGKLCRFTYFRGDLNKTIHSPTVSGLLANDSNKKIKDAPKNLNKKWRDQTDDNNDDDDNRIVTLKDLFAPSHYSNSDNVSSSSAGNLQNKSSTHLQPVTTVPSNATPVPDATKLFPKTIDHGASQGGTATGTIAESVSGETTPFWLDVLDPTEEEMKVLSKTFGIHPLTTEDIFLGEAREKVELFKSYYFICFTSFDIVYERRKQRLKEHERKLTKLQELSEQSEGFFSRLFRRKESQSQNDRNSHHLMSKGSSSLKSRGKKIREGELSPLTMYIIVFKEAVITFHFSATPHPINVRRRARLLKDYLNVTSDWISYALIDDITDSFAPMIESIEDEVNSIEEAILKMHAGNSGDDSDDDSDDSGSVSEHMDIFYKRQRSKSTTDKNGYSLLTDRKSKSSTSSSSKSKTTSKILGWKRKGDMLRRIGECRKRVMSVLRLLGSKADVIKGFNKRLNEALDSNLTQPNLQRAEISMYLGDIQDHIVTMVQSLNHYEKLLARFHSNYLAQINIDMTKVNNDTNDVLGKITILGTIVLPVNVVTGLWGMNCLVPGQSYDGLAWFWSIIGGMILFSIVAYNYAKRVYGL